MDKKNPAKPKRAGKNGNLPPENPPGRPKGVPNKRTILAREAIAQFVDGNAHRLSEWLDRIAEDSPKDAFNCFQAIIEFHIPKLARTDSVSATLDVTGAAVKLDAEAEARIRDSITQRLGLKSE